VYDHHWLQRKDHKIEKLHLKHEKMMVQYKNLYGILINSEHRKKEKDLQTEISVKEAELDTLRDHFNRLVKANEKNIHAIYKTS
jgi:hypothetical protein